MPTFEKSLKEIEKNSLKLTKFVNVCLGFSLPEATLLIIIKIIVPRFFENEADFRTDAIAPTALENKPKPTPNAAPNHSQ